MTNRVHMKTMQPAPRPEDGDVCIENPRGASPDLVAYNQGGFDCTSVPLRVIVRWVREHRPDLLAEDGR